MHFDRIILRLENPKNPKNVSVRAISPLQHKSEGKREGECARAGQHTRVRAQRIRKICCCVMQRQHQCYAPKNRKGLFVCVCVRERERESEQEKESERASKRETGEKGHAGSEKCVAVCCRVLQRLRPRYDIVAIPTTLYIQHRKKLCTYQNSKPSTQKS